MTSIIDERICFLNSNNIGSFYLDVSKIVNHIEPSLEINEIEGIIQDRDKLGDGLVNSESLIVHVISNKVADNIAVYCYLKNSILWQSKITDLSASVKKAAILIVNPDLKDGRLLNLENFIDNKVLNNVKFLAMR